MSSAGAGGGRRRGGVFEDDVGDGEFAFVGEGEVDALHGFLFGEAGGAAVQADGGFAAGIADDFDVGECGFGACACAEGLEEGFFGSEARGEVFVFPRSREAVVGFCAGEYFLQEALAVAFDAGADAGDADDVGACSEYHEGFRLWLRVLCASGV